MIILKSLRHYKSLCAFSAIFIYLLSSCSHQNQEISRESHESLGTIITINLYGTANKRLFSESFEIVDQIHDLMSLQVPTSDLNRLNESAGIAAVNVDPLTMEVLQEAVRIAHISDSAFTPVIQPLVELWDITGVDPHVPERDEIEYALGRMDINDLILTPAAESESGLPRAYLAVEGMGVDLGGIAKGFAADLVKEYLVSQGVERAILDFGGNIVTIGNKGGSQNPDQSWTIGIQRPDQQRGVYLGTIPSVDNSVVTSGVYERFFVQNGVHYHHLLDRNTGFPADNLLEGVVIIADNSMLADGYSTAVFVLGLEEGLELAEATPEIEAIFITEGKTVYSTSGIGGEFEIRDSEYSLAEDSSN